MGPDDSRLQRIRRLARLVSDPLSPAPSLGLASPHQRPAFAASFSQLRFWRLDQQSDGTACAIPDVLHLHGELQPAALQSALDRLVERHEPLRTTYLRGAEDLLQVVEPPQGVELQIESLPQNVGLEAVTARIQRELERPFDTAHDPLMRCVLFHGRHGEHVLLLVFHYSAFDGWSRTVLYRELAVLYEAAVEGSTSPLPKLPLRYVDYAHWQRSNLAAEGADKLLGYWSEALRNLPRVMLPVDRPTAPRPTYRGLSAYFELDRSLLAGLENLCRSVSATIPMGLLALVASLLHLQSGQEDIGIGIPLAGRRHPALEPLIGSFINLLIIRIDLSDKPSFRQLLGRVRTACLQAYDHQNLPFVILQEALWPLEPPHAHVPVVVQLMDLPWQPSFRGLAVRRLPSYSRRARYDLEFRFRHLPGGTLQAKIIYSTDRFTEPAIRALFERMRLLLGGLLAEPALTLTAHG